MSSIIFLTDRIVLNIFQVQPIISTQIASNLL